MSARRLMGAGNEEEENKNKKRELKRQRQGGEIKNQDLTGEGVRNDINGFEGYKRKTTIEVLEQVLLKTLSLLHLSPFAEESHPRTVFFFVARDLFVLLSISISLLCRLFSQKPL